MNSWWRCFYSAFTPNECQSIIEYAQKIPEADGAIGYGGKTILDKGFRESTIRWMRRDDPHINWIFERMQSLMLKANSEAFGFDIQGFNEIQFTEYHSNLSGHYNWHTDNNWKKNTPYDRKLSMVIQLSNRDNYEGGRLELENDPLPDNVFRDVGDVIVFPSFNKHRVTNVTKGTRYSLVTWFVGPKFR